MTATDPQPRPGVIRRGTLQLDPNDKRRRFELDAGTRLLEFVLSNNSVDVIMGPLGSGKTHALFARLMRHAQEQRQSTLDGLRKTRWAVVRNTYPELKKSTIRTWNELVPEETYGRMNWSVPPMHRLKFPLGDGTFVQVEVDFLALDKAEDMPKLRSTEYTGIVFNELQYINKAIFDEADSRLRYPPKSEGGATWRGMFADMNAPDEDHWTAIMRGLVDVPPGLTDEDQVVLGTWPEQWGFFRQPTALIEKLDQHGHVIGYSVNPHAENLKNLDDDYYLKQIIGKTKAWIDSRLMVRVVLVVDGSPVWPMFKTETHVAAEVLRPHREYDVIVGLDYGRQPAAVFMQLVNNRVLVQYELVGHNEGSTDFAPRVRRLMAQRYPDHPIDRFRFFGDPKGEDMTQVDNQTAVDIFRHNGMIVRDAPGLKQNDIDTRVSAVANLLNEMHDGRPRFVLSPLCIKLKVAMAGRYHIEKDPSGTLKPRPKKDIPSNICDALQYGCLGIGEGRRMVGRSPLGEMRPVQVYRRKSSRLLPA